MDDGDDMDMSLDGTTSKRACDSCRTRKIRCDRGVPCSNCKASKLTCTTTAPTQKAQRQRIHISEEYEKKIDRIEDRLAGIEHVLANLADKLGNLDVNRESAESGSQSRASRVGASARSPGGSLAEAATPAPFEGETAIARQSDYARDLLAQAVGRTPSIVQNAEIKSALTALGDLVSQQSHSTVSAHPLINRGFAEWDPATLEKPPWQEVANALDKAMKYPTMAFAVIFPFLKMKNLREIFEDAYHNAGSCPAPRRVLAYGIMENLFVEFKAFPLAQMDISNYGLYSSQCKRHLEVAMSQLDIFMPASYENIMALLLGAAQSIEMCKPSLCWVMISTAAGLCQHLGYHRINTMLNDTLEVRNSKTHIFWMIYMFDKTLSLRLGRASVIQDWDISLPFMHPNEEPTSGPDGTQMLAYWIKVARVQGQIYEKLFCPAAFLRTSEERTRTAIELVDAMNQAWYERGEATVIDFTGEGENIKFVPQKTSTMHTSPSETELPSKRKRVMTSNLRAQRLDATEYIKGSFERIQDIFFHSDVVMHYSTCALIQRAVSPEHASFNQECLESSKAALAAHMCANQQFNTEGNEELWSGYIHWSILQAPFTPFIVLFCNAIQQADSSDLNSLSDFVASLESCRTISEGADKLYKMCSIFALVAKLYVKAKKQDGAMQSQTVPLGQPNYYSPSTTTSTTTEPQLDMNTMASFDPYLSALGLMPNASWSMAGYSDAPVAPTMDPTSYGHGSQGFAAGLGAEVPNLGPGVGFGAPGGNQNSMLDWFSGSRFLMNVMEAGDDLQMPDLDL
ncbi:hypothetical protein ACN47E_007505 [Coniothyrium glycines]